MRHSYAHRGQRGDNYGFTQSNKHTSMHHKFKQHMKKLKQMTQATITKQKKSSPKISIYLKHELTTSLVQTNVS
jgi:hypothetical protein